MRKGIILLTLSLELAACGPTGSGQGGAGGHTADGTGGSSTGGTSGSGGAGGAGTSCGGIDSSGGCANGAQYIYLVDENSHFFRYNPGLAQGQRYMDLGVLNCPSTGLCDDGLGGVAPATPFSMSVDRNAMAWVLYCDGSLFKVDINHNIACTATTFQPDQNGFEVFGMGFSADQPMQPSETLFIGGGAVSSIDTGIAQFGSISFPAMAVYRIGSVNMGWPELTGTGDAELWGFFPSDFDSPRIAKLNKQSGTDLMSYNVPSIVGMPAAWAFAFWCDGFYIFLMRTDETQTTVYHVRRSDGAVDPLPFDTSGPHTIVGAGVSTCAPIVGVHGNRDDDVAPPATDPR